MPLTASSPFGLSRARAHLSPCRLRNQPLNEYDEGSATLRRANANRSPNGLYLSSGSILRGRRASALVAARALAEHPDRNGTATMIRSMLCELPRECVALAVWAYLRLSDDEVGEVFLLAHSRNESVREAVARVGSLGDDGRPTSTGLHLAKDSVRQIRLAVIQRMKDAGEEVSQDILRLLEEMTASDDPPFTCCHCGAECEADQDSCSSSQGVTQRPSLAARQSLERLRPKTAAARK